MIIGKPRTGKSTLGISLAKSLDLVYIEPNFLIQKIIEKQAAAPNPSEVPEGEQVLFF